MSHRISCPIRTVAHLTAAPALLAVVGLLAVAASGATAGADDGAAERAAGEPRPGLREARPDEKPKVGPGSWDDLEFLGIEPGIERARKEHLGALVYYDGGPDYERKADDLPTAFEANLEKRDFRRAVAKMVAVFVRDADLARSDPFDRPLVGAAGERREGKDGGRGAGGAPAPAAAAKPPPTVRDRFGLVRGVPSLAFVDFHGRVHHRITTDVPSRSRLQRQMLSFAASVRSFALYVRKIEKVLEASRYAYELGQKRVAVLKVIPLEDATERRKMDDVLRRQVDAVTKRYRDDAGELLEKCYEKDRRKDYAAALEILEDVTRDYSFKDIALTAARKRAEILRKMQLGI